MKGNEGVVSEENGLSQGYGCREGVCAKSMINDMRVWIQTTFRWDFKTVQLFIFAFHVVLSYSACM